MNFKSVIRRKINFSGEELIIETGFLAQKADESVVVEMGGTKVLIALVLTKLNVFSVFTPLRVDYQERAYSYGKIPGGYLKREGRLSEREILISRLIDRSVRPLLPTRMNYDIQINVIALSIGSVDTDFLSILGTSVALSKSKVPLKKQPLVVVKVGFFNGEYFLNNKSHDLVDKEMSLVVAGTQDSILMVDVVSSEVSIDIIANGLIYGLTFFKELLLFINNFLCVFVIKKEFFLLSEEHNQLFTKICLLYDKNISSIYEQNNKDKRKELVSDLDKQIFEKFLILCDNDFTLLTYLKDKALKKSYKDVLITRQKRFDNRLFEEIRPISIVLDYLKDINGSVVFMRGNTQVLVTVTLGSSNDRQINDVPFAIDEKNSFIVHYNFPSFCVGEMGNSTLAPKRREIGHGNVVKRSLLSVFPNFDFYSKTVRVVTDVLMSDGSSSMASVCGASLALLCSGVPLKNSVAGIAMGFVSTKEDSAFLYDISGDEDCFSDFDFKISGTINGVTSIQMDTKKTGISSGLFNKVLYKGKQGYTKILDVMNLQINTYRVVKEDTYTNVFKIDVNKIKHVIGKGGSVIKSLLLDKRTNIDIEKNGVVTLTTKDEATYLDIKIRIENIARGPIVGASYNGVVSKITTFGLFITILPGVDGLLHISSLRKHVTEGLTIFDVFSVQQIIQVSVVDLSKNKIKLDIISV